MTLSRPRKRLSGQLSSRLFSRNGRYVKRRCGTIRPSEFQAMRRLLIAAVVAGTSLTAINPAEAKSLWLKCGAQVINLDSAKERFSLTRSGKVYQGQAMFSPGQINFEFQFDETSRGSAAKTVYSIDRKSLKYIDTIFMRIVISGYSDTGWVPIESTDKLTNPKSGKCSIMKTPPTAGNQI